MANNIIGKLNLQSNGDWLDLGSASSPVNNSICFPLWLNTRNNNFIFQASSACTYLGTYEYKVKLSTFNGMKDQAVVQFQIFFDVIEEAESDSDSEEEEEEEVAEVVVVPSGG